MLFAERDALYSEERFRPGDVNAAWYADLAKDWKGRCEAYPEGVPVFLQAQIAAEIIREKALHALDAEIPHGIAVAIDSMKERPGKRNIVDIDATIICERDSHKGIIIGKQGSMLKKIGSTARYEIERMLDCKVNLKLWVKVKKDWRDSEFLMKNFGYREEE